MNQQQKVKGGMRLFTELVNKSDKVNMYPVITNPEGQAELFHRRTRTDYSPKHDIKYVPPPVVKDVTDKSTFVHNCIANKNKSNIGHFDNIYNKKVFTKNKFEIIKIMHASNIDFRRLT